MYYSMFLVLRNQMKMSYDATARTGEPVAFFSFNGKIVKINSFEVILFKFVKFSTIKILFLDKIL